MKTFPYRVMVLLCYPEYSEGTIVVLSTSVRRVKLSRLNKVLDCTTTKLLEAFESLRQAGLIVSVTPYEDHQVLVSIRKQGVALPQKAN
jgi:hypothetical protein